MTPMFETLQQRAMKDRAEEQEGTIHIRNALFDQYKGRTMRLTLMIHRFNARLTHHCERSTKGSAKSPVHLYIVLCGKSRRAAQNHTKCKLTDFSEESHCDDT